MIFEYDKGDDPITLDEILDSIEEDPIFVRFLRRRGLLLWTPDLDPPPRFVDSPDPIFHRGLTE